MGEGGSKITKKVLTYFMDDPSPLLAHACGKVPKEVLAAVYTTILLLRLMYESVDEQVFFLKFYIFRRPQKYDQISKLFLTLQTNFK